MDFSDLLPADDAAVGAARQRSTRAVLAALELAASTVALGDTRELFSEILHKVVMNHPQGDDSDIAAMKRETVCHRWEKLLKGQTPGYEKAAKALVDSKLSEDALARAYAIVEDLDAKGFSFGWMFEGEPDPASYFHSGDGGDLLHVPARDISDWFEMLEKRGVAKDPMLGCLLVHFLPYARQEAAESFTLENILDISIAPRETLPALCVALMSAQIALVKAGDASRARKVFEEAGKYVELGYEAGLLIAFYQDFVAAPLAARPEDFIVLGEILQHSRALGLQDTDYPGIVAEIRQSRWKLAEMASTLAEAAAYAKSHDLKPADIFENSAPSMRDVIKALVRFVTQEDLAVKFPEKVIGAADPGYKAYAELFKQVVPARWENLLRKNGIALEFILRDDPALRYVPMDGSDKAYKFSAAILNHLRLAEKLLEPEKRHLIRHVQIVSHEALHTFFNEAREQDATSVGSRGLCALQLTWEEMIVRHAYSEANIPRSQEMFDRYDILPVLSYTGRSPLPMEQAKVQRKIECVSLARKILTALATNNYPTTVLPLGTLERFATEMEEAIERDGVLYAEAFLQRAKCYFQDAMLQRTHTLFMAKDSEAARERRLAFLDKFVNACWPDDWQIHSAELQDVRQNFSQAMVMLSESPDVMGFNLQKQKIEKGEGITTGIFQTPCVSEALVDSYTDDPVNNAIISLIILFTTMREREDLCAKDFRAVLAYIEEFLAFQQIKPPDLLARFDTVDLFLKHPEFKDNWQVKAVKALLEIYAQCEPQLRKYQWSVTIPLVSYSILLRLFTRIPAGDFALLYLDDNQLWDPLLFYRFFCAESLKELDTARQNILRNPDPGHLQAVREIFQEIHKTRGKRFISLEVQLSEGFKSPLVADIFTKTIYANTQFFTETFASGQDKAVMSVIVSLFWHLQDPTSNLAGFSVSPCQEAILWKEEDGVLLFGARWDLRHLMAEAQARLTRHGLDMEGPLGLLLGKVPMHLDLRAAAAKGARADVLRKARRIGQRDRWAASSSPDGAFAAMATGTRVSVGQTGISQERLILDVFATVAQQNRRDFVERYGMENILQLPPDPEDLPAPAGQSGSLDAGSTTGLAVELAA